MTTEQAWIEAYVRLEKRMHQAAREFAASSLALGTDNESGFPRGRLEQTARDFTEFVNEFRAAQSEEYKAAPRDYWRLTR